MLLKLVKVIDEHVKNYEYIMFARPYSRVNGELYRQPKIRFKIAKEHKPRYRTSKALSNIYRDMLKVVEGTEFEEASATFDYKEGLIEITLEDRDSHTAETIMDRRMYVDLFGRLSISPSSYIFLGKKNKVLKMLRDAGVDESRIDKSRIKTDKCIIVKNLKEN